MQLTGQVALVTGAGAGIGKGCALELARAGANLAITDIDATALKGTFDKVCALGVQCVHLVGNVFKKKQCQTLVKHFALALGGIDILVSVPSWNRKGNFLDYDPEVFVATIHATLIAGFYISQPTAQNMVECGKGGNIIFISSIESIMPFSRCPAYVAGKRGLEALAETMAADLVQNNIRVNTIRPGWIDTPLERRKFSETMDQEGSKLPLRRLGNPKDIGKTVVAICSLPYMTGQHIGVDGGLFLNHVRELRRDLNASDNIDSPIPDYD